MTLTDHQKRVLCYTHNGHPFADCHYAREDLAREITLRALLRKGLVDVAGGRWVTTQAGNQYIQDRQRSYT